MGTFSILFWLWFNAYSQTVLLPAGLCLPWNAFFFFFCQFVALDFVRTRVSERQWQYSQPSSFDSEFSGTLLYFLPIVFCTVLGSRPPSPSRNHIEQRLLEAYFQCSSIQQVLIRCQWDGRSRGCGNWRPEFKNCFYHLDNLIAQSLNFLFRKMEMRKKMFAWHIGL